MAPAHTAPLVVTVTMISELFVGIGAFSCFGKAHTLYSYKLTSAYHVSSTQVSCAEKFLQRRPAIASFTACCPGTLIRLPLPCNLTQASLQVAVPQAN
jgi:hypothetical protein